MEEKKFCIEKNERKINGRKEILDLEDKQINRL